MYIKDLFNLFTENYHSEENFTSEKTRPVFEAIVKAAKKIKDPDEVNQAITEILTNRTGIYAVDPKNVPVIRTAINKQIELFDEKSNTFFGLFCLKKKDPRVKALYALDQTLEKIEHGISLDSLYNHFIYKEEAIDVLEEMRYRIKTCNKKEITSSIEKFQKALLDIVKYIHEALHKHSNALIAYDIEWKDFHTEAHASLKQYEDYLTSLTDVINKKDHAEKKAALKKMKTILADLLKHKSKIFKKLTKKIKNTADIPKPIESIEQ